MRLSGRLASFVCETVPRYRSPIGSTEYSPRPAATKKRRAATASALRSQRSYTWLPFQAAPAKAVATSPSARCLIPDWMVACGGADRIAALDSSSAKRSRGFFRRYAAALLLLPFVVLLGGVIVSVYGRFDGTLGFDYGHHLAY